MAADLGAAASAMKQAASAASASTTDASIVDAIQAAAAAIQAAAASAQDVASQVQGLVSPAVPVAKEVRAGAGKSTGGGWATVGAQAFVPCSARSRSMRRSWAPCYLTRHPVALPPRLHPSWPPPPRPTWLRARWPLWRWPTWHRRWPRMRPTVSAVMQVGWQVPQMCCHGRGCVTLKQVSQRCRGRGSQTVCGPSALAAPRLPCECRRRHPQHRL